VAFGEVADADGGEREVVFVVVVPAEGFAGGLRDAVEVPGPREFRAVEPEVVVAAVEAGFAVGLVVADGVVRGREHEPVDARVDGGLEDGLGAVDVVPEDAVPGRLGPGVAGEVDDGADPVDGVADGVLVGDVGDDELVGGLPRGGFAVEQPPLVVVPDAVEDGLADAPGGAREEDRLVHSSSVPRVLAINGAVRRVCVRGVTRGR